MSKETPVLVAKKRDKLGTRYSKRLRDAGEMPANVYGHGSEPLAISLNSREIMNALKKGTHVLELKFDDGKSDTVLVKDLQFGFLGDNVIHLDLARVNLDEMVKVKVHLSFIGTPEAAKKPGTILVHEMPEIEVSCKVRAIPEEIKIDLSQMGEILTVADLKLPAGVTAASDPAHVVCRIEVVKEEEVSAEAAAAAAKVEPEVLTAKKDEVGELADTKKKKD